MTYLELLQHLKSYQAVIYTGNKEADLDLIQEELDEQRRLGLIDSTFYADARIVIHQERQKLT
ncbi:YqgQ family protein [Alkalicoccus chagannorensis]|uniref:YqgQ family protein n=1 Tax=Alkalicoccus chagannorensis TaxID=427072 RepID=UPI00041980D4|nr:YqgQ family protein [Alkalicoccus chagannorensis]